ncbi:hypothetical protein [Rickettsia bellii]|uniref:Uncharacterized protein n=1 Tax=Rickettsia bellii (strain RML369-C) TaxID=336407 RepID=Q1RID8_RICBR|nr:hypothetical protein [Rickettsia bellii]ABE04876.1 unknown [Rickettsia bellii RML369-C]
MQCVPKKITVFTHIFANTCGVIAEKIPVLAEGLYRCTIDSASIISSFKEMPCNPIRWNPTALVNKFCSTVGNNIGSFNTTTLTPETAFWGNTTIPTTETPLWDSTTPAEDPNNDIIKLIGVGAAAAATIAIYTGYRYFKSSKSTPKNTTNTELELSSRKEDIESASNLLQPTFSMREDFQAAGIRINAFNSQEDKESTSPLLPTLEESNTSTELHYDIPTSNRPVTGIYEEIGQKIETSNLLDAAREVSNRLNDLVDELELTNIVISSNDHTVPNNEPALLGDDSTVIEVV